MSIQWTIYLWKSPPLVIVTMSKNRENGKKMILLRCNSCLREFKQFLWSKLVKNMPICYHVPQKVLLSNTEMQFLWKLNLYRNHTEIILFEKSIATAIIFMICKIFFYNFLKDKDINVFLNNSYQINIPYLWIKPIQTASKYNVLEFNLFLACFHSNSSHYSFLNSLLHNHYLMVGTKVIQDWHS